MKKLRREKNQSLEFCTGMDIRKFIKRRNTSSEDSSSSKSAKKIFQDKVEENMNSTSLSAKRGQHVCGFGAHSISA